MFNAFITSVFNPDGGPRNPQSSELEDCDNELPDTPKLVQDLLFYLDANKSVASDGIQTRLLKELVDVITRLLSIIFSAVLRIWGVPSQLAAGKCPSFEEGQERFW